MQLKKTKKVKTVKPGLKQPVLKQTAKVRQPKTVKKQTRKKV